jgi:hypothetical protein
MKARPTKYGGFTFRSRLEARWAAFFDACGWQWDYEPAEFDGWVPDFLLKTKKQRTWVEVKPIAFTGDQDRDRELLHGPELAKVHKITSAIRDVSLAREERAVIAPAHFDDEYVVLGNGPFFPVLDGWKNDHPFLGYFIVSTWNVDYPDPMVLLRPMQNPLDGYDFAAWYGSYERRFSGLYDGDKYFANTGFERARELWGEASTALQWRPV